MSCAGSPICVVSWGRTCGCGRTVLSVISKAFLPRPLLDQFHLLEVELDRGRAAEDRDRDLDLVLVEVELLDHAVEARERAVEHLDLVADLVIDADLLARGRLGLGDAAEVARRLALGD